MLHQSQIEKSEKLANSEKRCETPPRSHITAILLLFTHWNSYDQPTRVPSPIAGTSYHTFRFLTYLIKREKPLPAFPPLESKNFIICLSCLSTFGFCYSGKLLMGCHFCHNRETALLRKDLLLSLAAWASVPQSSILRTASYTIGTYLSGNSHASIHL